MAGNSLLLNKSSFTDDLYNCIKDIVYAAVKAAMDQQFEIIEDMKNKEGLDPNTEGIAPSAMAKKVAGEVVDQLDKESKYKKGIQDIVSTINDDIKSMSLNITTIPIVGLMAGTIPVTGSININSNKDSVTIS